MTNIFNKKILVNNGTLIGNWYEEEVLRNVTGEGRSLSKKHIPKNFMNFYKDIENPWPIENTFERTLGERNYSSFSTSTGEIGNFPNLTEKYQTKGKNEENFKKFLNSKSQFENEKGVLDEANLKSIRFFNTSNKNQYISQEVDYNNLGRRLMKTQDSKDIANEKIDKNFMALHQTSKFPRIISDGEVNEYMDKTVPYYKDKEITFWSTNMNKGNVYRSFLKGENSFTKSSGFTQPIHKTRSVEQFNGNITNTSNSNSVLLNEEHTKFIEKYNESILKKNQPLDLTANIKTKLFNKFYESWITLRKLRNYLKNLNRKSKNSDFIDSTNFKYYLVKFGIYFDDAEIKFIFDKFDKNRNDLINFNEFLDFFTECSEERKKFIKQFYDQVKCKDKNYAIFKNLELLLKPDLHPEVNKYYYIYIGYSIKKIWRRSEK